MDSTGIISLIGVIQATFILALLIPQIKNNRPPFFAFLLILVFILDLATYGLFRANVNNRFWMLVGLGESTLFLYGPILYLYVSSILNDNRPISLKRNILHFIPAIVVYLLLSPLFFREYTLSGLAHLKQSLPLSFSKYHFKQLIFDQIIWYVHVVAYFLGCLLLLKKNRSHELKSSKAVKKIRLVHFRWLGYLLLGYLVFPVLGLLSFSLNQFAGATINTIPLLSSLLVFHVFGISYIGFYNQKLLTNPMGMIKYRKSS